MDMAFLYEKDLKEKFWESYNRKGRAIKYEFESPIRDGNADLITIEKYQERYQINSFEFKLDDIKKVMLQAEANLPFVNKSWIVIPIEKEKYKHKFKSPPPTVFQRRTNFKLDFSN